MKFDPRKATVVVALAASGLAQAAAVAHGPVTIGSTSTDWDSFIGLARFDPALGTLQSVDIALTGHLDGHAGVENLSYRSATVTLGLHGALELQRPDGSPLIWLPDNVLIGMTIDLPKFDGEVDFGGHSGTMLSPDTLTVSGSTSLSGAGDLALFTGAGVVNLPIRAFADSAFVGPGNAKNFFNMMAGVSASVSYTYAAATLPSTPVTPVPEPASYALMALGLLGIGLAARRRTARA